MHAERHIVLTIALTALLLLAAGPSFLEPGIDLALLLAIAAAVLADVSTVIERRMAVRRERGKKGAFHFGILPFLEASCLQRTLW